MCKGQPPVSLCKIRSLQGKGNLTRYREKRRGREREREGEEETLRASERSVGNQFPRRITTAVRSLFVTLSLSGEPDRDLDSFSSDCEPRERERERVKFLAWNRGKQRERNDACIIFKYYDFSLVDSLTLLRSSAHLYFSKINISRSGKKLLCAVCVVEYFLFGECKKCINSRIAAGLRA